MSTCECFIENKSIYSSVEMQDKFGGLDFNSGLLFACSFLFCSVSFQSNRQPVAAPLI